MFRKLVHYEIKAAGKWYFMLYGATLLVATLLGFMIRSAVKPDTHSDIWYTDNTFTIFLTMTFVALIVGLFISTLILIITRFYKNIYGREGYLTLTLPVNPHLIILSKLATSTLWIVLSWFVLGFSFLLLSLPSVGLSNLLSHLPRLRPYIFSSEALLVIVVLLVSILASILTFYLAISIGQLFQNRRGLFAFITYFAIYICRELVNITLQSTLIYNLSEVDFMSTLTFSLIEGVIVSTAFYFLTHYLMTQKLNIQ